MRKSLLNLDVSNMDEYERFELLSTVPVNKRVLNYLKSRLKNLSIKIGAKTEENIIVLMNKGLLEGWCWQTTESLVVFLDDASYIERGNLKFSPKRNYWHSWISFKLNNKSWIFDPCLQILVPKEIYYQIFEVTKISGKIDSKAVKEDLIYRINHPKKEIEKYENTAFMKILRQYVPERQKREIIITGNDDVNSPMYRNNTGYIAEIDNGKFKTLFAHYYFNA